jgi:hypothetical protein
MINAGDAMSVHRSIFRSTYTDTMTVSTGTFAVDTAARTWLWSGLFPAPSINDRVFRAVGFSPYADGGAAGYRTVASALTGVQLTAAITQTTAQTVQISYLVRWATP